jgi:hypothetical protein
VDLTKLVSAIRPERRKQPELTKDELSEALEALEDTDDSEEGQDDDDVEAS